ncbi:MAG: alpha/beta hydrolase [Pseudomonadales bacterium]|jgi:acetyl esterase/lipase|nr:alpha/beta hydrolase [Pseudomonadales bacterium]
MNLAELRQRLGLVVVNAIAHSVPATREQVAYGHTPRHHLDWYRRRGGERRPTVLFFYGGNWRSGRRQDYRFVADTLMTLDCDVVVPDYRLYPHVRFSEILQDAREATEAVLARLPEGEPLVLMGHSAGAQLAALLTLDASLLRDPSRIAGCIGLAGPYDFYPFTEDDHWELFGPEEAYPSSQPVNFVRADAAPLYLLHGETDQRVHRGHSKSLMEKQRAAGGVAEREVYPGMGHVEIIVEFTRLHRRRSAVVRDIGRFVQRVAGGAG